MYGGLHPCEVQAYFSSAIEKFPLKIILSASFSGYKA